MYSIHMLTIICDVDLQKTVAENTDCIFFFRWHYLILNQNANCLREAGRSRLETLLFERAVPSIYKSVLVGVAEKP